MHNCWFEQILIHIFQTLNIEKQWNCITTSDHHIEQLHYKKNHIKGQKIALIETEKQPRLCNTCRNTMRSMWDTHYALAVLLFPSLYTNSASDVRQNRGRSVVRPSQRHCVAAIPKTSYVWLHTLLFFIIIPPH